MLEESLFFTRPFNDAGSPVTGNLTLYRSMLTRSFWPELNAINSEKSWFEQDLVTANQTIHLLKGEFGESIISRTWLSSSLILFNFLKRLSLGLCYFTSLHK